MRRSIQTSNWGYTDSTATSGHYRTSSCGTNSTSTSSLTNDLVYFLDGSSCSTAITSTNDCYKTYRTILTGACNSLAWIDDTNLVSMQYTATTSGTCWVDYVVWDDSYGTSEPTLTEEERNYRLALRARDEAIKEHNQWTRDIKRLAADRKAMSLLCKHISDEQRECLLHNGWLDAEGADGKMYRLFYTYHGNWVRYDVDGTIEATYCGHLGSDLPIADTLMGQLLMLSTDPRGYEAQANKMNKQHHTWCRPMDHFAVQVEYAMGIRERVEPIVPPEPEKPQVPEVEPEIEPEVAEVCEDTIIPTEEIIEEVEEVITDTSRPIVSIPNKRRTLQYTSV